MKKDKYNIAEDEDYFNAASANDCTGLIPANQSSLEALETYKEIYPFCGPELKEKSNDCQ